MRVLAQYTKQLSLALCLVAMLGALVSPASAQTCPPSDDYYLLDATDNKVIGTRKEVAFPSGSYGAKSMVMTTVPDYEQWGFSFVAHGGKIHMLYHGTGSGDGLLTSDDPFPGALEDDSLITFDVVADTGLSGTVFINDLAVGEPVELSDGSYQYTLYGAGLRADGMNPPEPYYFVFDQKAMLERFEIQNSTDPSLYTAPPYVLRYGKLCQNPQSCSGIAGEIQVYSPGGKPSDQYAYAQGLSFTTNPMKQQIVKLQRLGDSSWSVTQQYEMVPNGVITFPHMGLAFDESTHTPYGGLGQQVLNLETGQAANCNMGGTVTDLSIWYITHADDIYTKSSYTFATVVGSTSSTLVGFPTGTCPSPGADSTIQLSVGHQAIKTLMYRDDEASPFIIHVLATDNTVKSFEMNILPGYNTADDEIVVLNTSTASLGSGLMDISAKPINLGCCQRITEQEGKGIEVCEDQCSVPEDGERECFLGIGTDAQPPRCLDPDDIRCNSGVGGGKP